MIQFSRDEFATQRKAVLERAEAELLPKVKAALARWGHTDWWLSILDAIEPVFDDAYADVAGERPTGDRAAGLKEALGAALKQTKKPDSSTLAMVTRLVAAAAVNAGTEAAAEDDSETLDLEWVTMHDSHVRASHRDADGQTRKIGEPFHIGESELDYPGDPKGHIEDWIGCRCVLRPTRAGEHALTASAGNAQANTSSVIVALPSQGDAVHDMGPEDAHCTLVWLGDAEGVDASEILPHLAQLAEIHQPVTEGVSGRAELGQDKAQVLLLDADGLAAIRNDLLNVPYIGGTNASADSHPTWIPHTTLGYPGQGDISTENPSEITFDRLALWHGDQQTEFPLGEPMTDTTQATEDQTAPPSSVQLSPARIPWHGPLAVEGKPTGDKRKFKQGSLRNRDLPLQLTWQEATSEGHDQAHFVATIEHLMRQPNEDGTNTIYGAGHFRTTPQADKAIGAVADMGKHGVSIDADDSSYEFDDQTGAVEFTDARISGACLVNIPAFAEAYIQLGEAPWLTGLDSNEQMSLSNFAIVDKAWDGSSGRFTPEQWRSSCVLHVGNSLNKSDHKLPIKEPNGDLNKNAVHNAAARINQVKGAPSSAVSAAKSALRGAYRQLGEQAPFDTEVETFDRGPGWVTDPVDTRRIHRYWTEPGQPGYEDIAWGTPGDFDRCRVEIGGFLAADGKPEFINQTCAQWHYDALGEWPATHAKEIRHGLNTSEAVSLVASAAGQGWLPPAEFFQDPQFSEPTRVTYVETDKGTRVFGYIAEWGVCHAAFPGQCVTAPPSQLGYLDFLQAQIELDDGTSILVGQLTVGGGHAPDGLTMRAAMEHYDNVSTAVADVIVGEDNIGIWYSGAIRPWATEQQRYELKAAKLSGDWREHGVGGPLEMVAAHAVNTPGFKTTAGTVGGRQVSLVAAGALEPDSLPPLVLNVPELVAEGIRQYETGKTKLAERAERVEQLMKKAGADTDSRLARLQAHIGTE